VNLSASRVWWACSECIVSGHVTSMAEDVPVFRAVPSNGGPPGRRGSSQNT
jgi:hypothetical protein